MVTAIISNILNELTGLLADNISPHLVSCRFEQIANSLNKENLLIERIDCKDYYDDGDLALILIMKNEALANAHFEQASRFGMIEKELLEEKGCSEFTQLKTEPSFFDHRNGRIIFHFNKEKENQRLIANLIEGYNLVHVKTGTRSMISC